MSHVPSSYAVAKAARNASPIEKEDSVPSLVDKVRAILVDDIAIMKGIVTPDDLSLPTVMGSLTPAAVTPERYQKWYSTRLPKLEEVLAQPETQVTLSVEDCATMRKEILSYVTRAVKRRDNDWVTEIEKHLPHLLEVELYEPIRTSKGEVQGALANLTLASRLLSGATRVTSQPYKQQQAIKKYEKDILFLIEQTKAYETAHAQYTLAREGAGHIRTNNTMSELAEPDSNPARLLKQYDAATQAGVASTRALENEKLAYFNNGSWSMDSCPTPASLQVPADMISHSRNDWIMRELPLWYRTRVKSLFTVIPYLDRILNDYNSRTSVYWAAPDIHHTGDIPEVIRETWIEQNLALGNLLTNAMPLSLQQAVTAPYLIGNKTDMVQVDKRDGLAMVCSLLTQASPHTSEYKAKIDTNLFAAGEKAKEMGDPVKFVKNMREDLLEAARLNVPFRWHIGATIITALTCKHTLFGRELEGFSRTCTNEEDSGPHMELLLSKILTTNQMICDHENNHAWWNSTMPSAHLARGNNTHDSDPTNHAGTQCRFGTNCKFIGTKCKRTHVKLSDKKGKHPKAANPNAKQCLAQGCYDSAHPKGDLCTTHFKQSQKDGYYQNKADTRKPVTVNKLLRKRLAAQASAKQEKAAQKRKREPATSTEKTAEPTHTFSSAQFEQARNVMAQFAAMNNSSQPAAAALTHSVPTITVPSAQPTSVTMTSEQFAALMKDRVRTGEGNLSSVTDLNAMSAVGILIDHNVRGPTSKKQKVKDILMEDKSILAQANKLHNMILKSTK